MAYTDFVPQEVDGLYEIYNFKSAAEILATSCPNEFQELMKGFLELCITLDDIRKPGGNESEIPKKITAIFRDKGWLETRIKGDLLITKVSSPPKQTKTKAKAKPADPQESEETAEAESETEILQEIEKLKNQGAQTEELKRENFLDGHKVDYVKNRVAFDLEWNSKDQTFDRDLYAFRAFYECDLIDAAVLMTRSESLDDVFIKMGAELNADGTEKKDKKGNTKYVKSKYGASTTHMGKLLYRITAGRNGGCPVLVLGITPNLIADLSDLDNLSNTSDGDSPGNAV